MKSLHLTDVETFPFIEPPQGRAIADGYQLLQEVGAVDDTNHLTPLGHQDVEIGGEAPGGIGIKLRRLGRALEGEAHAAQRHVAAAIGQRRRAGRGLDPRRAVEDLEED